MTGVLDQWGRLDAAVEARCDTEAGVDFAGTADAATRAGAGDGDGDAAGALPAALVVAAADGGAEAGAEANGVGPATATAVGVLPWRQPL